MLLDPSQARTYPVGSANDLPPSWLDFENRVARAGFFRSWPISPAIRVVSCETFYKNNG